MKLVLASGSPRRAHLLELLGLAFEVDVAGVDETLLPGELPANYVERLAREKASAVASDDVVLAADTAVVFEGHVLGKPAHPAEARSMLTKLSGNKHEVFTGMAVRNGSELRSVVDMTVVEMMPMTELEISDYVSTGEPMDKAGSYALQGEGGRFVESIDGSPFTVIGLPIHLVDRLVTQVGARLDDFKRPAGV